MAIDPGELAELIKLGPDQLRTTAAILDQLHVAFIRAPGTWHPAALRTLADLLDQRAPEDPKRDEAIIACRSILGLLHHRGLVDSDRNREDVAKALDLIKPYSDEAEQRAMRAHDGG